MMKRAVVFGAAIVLVLLAVAEVGAQGWRGMGRAAGKVTDEQGQPLEGVVVKLDLPGVGGTQLKTNKKGEWAIGGISRGEWNVDFEKEGYEPLRISVSIAELTRIPPVETKLKKVAVDPNEVIKAELTKAAALLNEKKYAEARAIYEDLLSKFPQVYQLEPLIARTYYGEKQLPKAIEHLRIAVEKSPTNVEAKLLLGNMLMENGQTDEGKQVLTSIDDATVKDPIVFVNVGIGLLNQGKADDALPFFERAIARFPEGPDAYYYRALVRLQKGDTPGTKADLQKFLQLAPDAPEAPAAKKALEQIK